MIQGLYQSAAAAHGMQAWNDVIAANISGSTAMGFKKTAVTFEGVLAGGTGFQNGSGATVESASVAPRIRKSTNFTPGQIERSGDPQEFAIDGLGFFRLQAPDGTHVYTRDGQFRISGDGRLVSKRGFDVVSDAGPIQLQIEGGPLTVDPEGRVLQGDQEVGTLTVYSIRDTDALLRTNGGFLLDPKSTDFPVADPAVRVRQGYREMSNSSAIREMIEIMSVNNALQANQRMIQSLDGLTERAVQVLGNTGA